MRDRRRAQQLMPLLRELGSLERQRLAEGVTPLEYQRWLDLKTQLERSLEAPLPAESAASGLDGAQDRITRLCVSFKTRAKLLDAIVENIQPAGLFVATPFAASVGTRFVLRLTLESEGETAEVPGRVVTSFVQGAHTLSTTAMGMGLKLERPRSGDSARLSRLFGGLLDRALGLQPSG